MGSLSTDVSVSPGSVIRFRDQASARRSANSLFGQKVCGNPLSLFMDGTFMKTELDVISGDVKHTSQSASHKSIHETVEVHAHELAMLLTDTGCGAAVAPIKEALRLGAADLRDMDFRISARRRIVSLLFF